MEAAAVAAPAAVASPMSPISIALLAAGIIALLIASGVAVYVYRASRRNGGSFGGARRKGSMAISAPTLKFAPQHVVEGLDIRSMTTEQRDAAARRTMRPLGPSVGPWAAQTTAMRASESNSSSASSGPLPSSSSESTATAAGRRSESTTANMNARAMPPQIPSLPETSDFMSSSTMQQQQQQSRQTQMQQLEHDGAPAHLRTARVNRVAVPSMLLRSLGDLPALPVPGSKSGTARESTGAATLGDEGSLTPVLNLDLDLERGGASATSTGGRGLELEDELDFEIERSMWLTSTLQNAFEGRASSEQPRARDVETAADRAPKTRSRTSAIFQQITGVLDAAVAKPPKGSLPPTPAMSSSNVSLGPAAEVRDRAGSVTSRAGTTFSSGSSVYMSAGESIQSGWRRMVNDEPVPPMPATSQQHQHQQHKSFSLPFAHQQQPPQPAAPAAVVVTEKRGSISIPGSFRPLSLGFGKSSSSKSSLGFGTNLFSDARSSMWNGSNASGSAGSVPALPLASSDMQRSESDTSSSTITTNSNSNSGARGRSFETQASSTTYTSASSHAHSALSSSTSVEFEELNGAVVAQAAKAPAPSKAQLSVAPRRIAAPVVVPAPPQQASTSLDIPRNSPLPLIEEDSESLLSLASPARTTTTATRSSVSAPRPSATPALVPFMTPYHHAVFPDSLISESDIAAKAVTSSNANAQQQQQQQQQFTSPIMAQLSTNGNSPGTPVKASFASSLRARLTRSSNSKLSTGASPTLSARNSFVGMISSLPSPPAAQRPESSPFAGAMEQWAVSTRDELLPVHGQGAERNSSYLPTVTVCGPLLPADARRGSGVGLGLSNASGSIELQRGSGSLQRRGESVSPIMQNERWANELTDDSANISARSSHIPAEVLDATLSVATPHEESMSPLDVFEQRFSTQEPLSVASAAGAAGSAVGVSGASSPRLGSAAASPRLTFAQTLSPRTAAVGSPWSFARARRTSNSESLALASPRSDRADTISITSSCMTGGTDAMGEGHEEALDHRARLLRSVQINAAKAAGRQAGRQLQHVAQTHVQPSTDSVYAARKPTNLSVAVETSLKVGQGNCIGPLTPPLTPNDPMAISTSTSTVTQASVAAPTRPPPVAASAARLGSPLPELPSLSNGASSRPVFRPLSLTVTSSVLDSVINVTSPPRLAGFSPTGTSGSSGSLNSITSLNAAAVVASRTSRRISSRGGVLPVGSASGVGSPSFARPSGAGVGVAHSPPFSSPTPSSTIGARSPAGTCTPQSYTAHHMGNASSTTLPLELQRSPLANVANVAVSEEETARSKLANAIGLARAHALARAAAV